MNTGSNTTERRSYPDHSVDFSNASNVIALACDLLIENYSRVDDNCVMPASLADQVIAMLVMARDACGAKLAEAGHGAV